VKLSGRAFAILFALAGIGILAVTEEVLPPTSDYQAQMRVWLAARATGIVALVLLAAMVILGIVLSHPEQARWKQAKRIYPWHETLWVFVIAFLLVHVASLLLDPYADVSPLGALLPGFSHYRTVPVALGSIGLYATLITGATARWTRLLPSGVWLRLHRFAAVALALGWAHGVLAGTDSPALETLYGAIAVLVIAAAAYRYWIVRRRAERPVPASVVGAAGAAPRLTPHPLPQPVEVSHVQPDTQA
jgi:DMSO/TMAO reductase YedYZ heme-binding membrane subunit